MHRSVVAEGAQFRVDRLAEFVCGDFVVPLELFADRLRDRVRHVEVDSPRDEVVRDHSAQESRARSGRVHDDRTLAAASAGAGWILGFSQRGPASGARAAPPGLSGAGSRSRARAHAIVGTEWSGHANLTPLRPAEAAPVGQAAVPEAVRRPGTGAEREIAPLTESGDQPYRPSI